jgi:hypothetical protein
MGFAIRHSEVGITQTVTAGSFPEANKGQPEIEASERGNRSIDLTDLPEFSAGPERPTGIQGKSFGAFGPLGKYLEAMERDVRPH